MKTIVQVLRESKIPQSYGHLIELDPDTLQIRAKCALGDLACFAGFGNELLDSVIKYYDSWSIDEYESILQVYNVPDWLTGLAELPEIYVENCKEFSFENDNGENLQEWIVKLNDNAKLTKKEIADFLEETFPDTEGITKEVNKNE